MQLWNYLEVDTDLVIREVSPGVAQQCPDACPGICVSNVFSWLRPDWFKPYPVHKMVKITPHVRNFLDIIPFEPLSDGYRVYFRRADDYEDPEHLWCEVADSFIGVQKFIDTSYDGMTVVDGQGTLLAVNESFIRISGLERKDIVGRNMKELGERGLIPYSCSLETISTRASASAVVKYPSGKEAVVSSTPLFDRNGRIVRVLSNIRDLSQLNALQEKLRSAKALASGLQRELQAIQALSTHVCMRLSRSRAMENLYQLVTKVASTDLQLLITGESGVGKTALAKVVHSLSERNNSGTFIHVNCSAIPEALLESELFGHEEGAFTGAKKHKVGLFELANRGTMFLDEIGDMALPLQAKILNVLQEGRFYRVGGTKEIEVDVRIIAATNTRLDDRIASGAFRSDLYYRLNVIPIRIPPLRERREDIAPLVSHYVEVSNKRYNRTKNFSPDAMEVLMQYPWPGNIRELINLVERLVVIVDEPIIEVHHLPGDIVQAVNVKTTVKDSADVCSGTEVVGPAPLWRPEKNLKGLVEELEGRIIEEAVANAGSLKAASQFLGVDVTTLIRKRKRNP